MNWQVAEAALFHGGGSSGYCEDEMEKEMAAYAEHLRRRKTEAKVEGEHADDSAAMAAEHRSMRERERQAGLARVEAERKENQESTSLVGQQFGLPPELSEATRAQAQAQARSPHRVSSRSAGATCSSGGAARSSGRVRAARAKRPRSAD